MEVVDVQKQKQFKYTSQSQLKRPNFPLIKRSQTQVVRVLQLQLQVKDMAPFVASMTAMISPPRRSRMLAQQTTTLHQNKAH